MDLKLVVAELLHSFDTASLELCVALIKSASFFAFAAWKTALVFHSKCSHGLGSL